jgi:hypothetical protein
LNLKEIQIDRHPFPVNKLDLENPVVLIWPEQADTMRGMNVVISDPRPKKDVESTPPHKVVVEKLPDGEEMITITIRGSTTGTHTGKAEGSTLARNSGKREPTVTGQKQAIRLSPSRSDCQGGSDRVA